MLSVIIPVYRNVESIPELLNELSEVEKRVRSDYKMEMEVLFVVDGCPDGSFMLLSELLSEVPFNSTLLLHSRNFGSFPAIRSGLKSASGQFFVTISADLQEPPELILKFLNQLEKKSYDIVIGCRENRKDPFSVRFASTIFWKFYKRFVIKEIPDKGVDVFGCNRLFRDKLISLNESNSSLVGLIYWLGFRRKEVFYERVERRYGKSAWTFKKKINYLLDSIFSFSDLPIRLITLFGFFGLFVSFILGSIVLMARLSGIIEVPGYAATILAVITFGALNSLGIGIIGNYAWRIFENTKKRPLAVVMDKLTFKKNNNMSDYFVHKNGICETVNIGSGSRVWAFAHVLGGAVISRDCNICDGVFIENDVVIGDRVTVKSGVQLWDGLRVEDDVFIGPNATFTNDPFPRSKAYPENFKKTVLRKGASIGANATILPGIEIGLGSMIGAGAVVTRSVPPYSIVVGNPARIMGYVDTESQSIQSIEGNESVTVTNVRGVTLHDLPQFRDMRGSLSVGEFDRSVPFKAKRYFLVFDVPGKDVRGEHAHRECHQFLVCIKGSCNVLADDGNNRREFHMNRPNLGLYLPPMIWSTQFKYSIDAVLLVFASDYYDNSDYIRDYNQFKKIINKTTK